MILNCCVYNHSCKCNSFFNTKNLQKIILRKFQRTNFLDISSHISWRFYFYVLFFYVLFFYALNCYVFILYLLYKLLCSSRFVLINYNSVGINYSQFQFFLLQLTLVLFCEFFKYAYCHFVLFFYIFKHFITAFKLSCS